MNDEERKLEKKKRMLEKSMRMPLNDVVLEVQKGHIGLKDLLDRIEIHAKEVIKNG